MMIAIAWTLVALAFGADTATWEARLDTVRHAYDLGEAERLVQSMRDENAPATLVAEALLVVGELERLDYEDIATEAWKQRRELGGKIDAVAEEGLHALEDHEETSETWRLRADLYGLMIRTDFQATKYRQTMIDAADRAMALDPRNPLAYLSRAKPYLFADRGRGQDLDEATRLIDRALALNPDLESARLLKAFALHEQKHTPEAIALLEKLLAENPNCKPAHRWLAEWNPGDGVDGKR